MTLPGSQSFSKEYEQAGKRRCRRIRVELIDPGLWLGGKDVAGPMSVPAGLLMCGRLCWVSATMPRLGEHRGGDPASQGEGRGDNPAHHPDTNGPGRRSPAVTARRPTAVP